MPKFIKIHHHSVYVISFMTKLCYAFYRIRNLILKTAELMSKCSNNQVPSLKYIYHTYLNIIFLTNFTTVFNCGCINSWDVELKKKHKFIHISLIVSQAALIASFN